MFWEAPPIFKLVVEEWASRKLCSPVTVPTHDAAEQNKNTVLTRRVYVMSEKIACHGNGTSSYFFLRRPDRGAFNLKQNLPKAKIR